MAYQNWMSKNLQHQMQDDPIYWALMQQIGILELNGPDDDWKLFYQESFMKKRDPQGLEFLAAVGYLRMLFWGSDETDNRKYKKPYAKIKIPTAKGAYPDKREKDNQTAIENALERASMIHKKEFGRAFDYSVEVNTTPPNDGRVFISEVCGTVVCIQGEDVVRRDVIVDTSKSPFDLEIGYTQIHTISRPLLTTTHGIMRFPYKTANLLLVTPAERILEVLSEEILEPDSSNLSSAARHMATFNH